MKFTDEQIGNMTERLLSMIGQPFVKPNGCLPFLKQALEVLGIEIEGTFESRVRDGTQFSRIDKGELDFTHNAMLAQFGDVILWERPIVEDNEQYKFHLGLMLDKRYAIQSSVDTNGVGKVEISREPWRSFFRAFYRPKALI